MKKILVLSIGVGAYSRIAEGISEFEKDDVIELLQDEKSCHGYGKTTYQIGESTYDSEYVATALVEEFKPDEVYVIGTVKSLWLGLYRKFCPNYNDEGMYQLFSIWNTNNIFTEKQEIEKAQEEIQEIFTQGRAFSEFGVKECKVIVTCYGINNDELSYNYQRISDTFKKLPPNTKYEVAFDITHSFRSMPFYDLVVLNYLKEIMDVGIDITHIYYGNVEIIREYGKAPIVDIANLVDVLNLTSAVSEFKDTGSANAILRLLPDEDDDIKKSLEMFDFAIQSNDLLRIQVYLKKLLFKLEIKTRDDGETSQYEDLYGLILKALREKLPSREDYEKLESLESFPAAYTHIQRLIGEWFYSQKRYGQSLLVLMEAIKSALVPLILKCRNINFEIESFENEDYRNETFHLLSSIYDSRANDEVNLFIKKIEAKRRELNKYRNRYAHMLGNSDVSTNANAEYDSRKNTIDKIEELFRLLKTFETKLANDFDDIVSKVEPFVSVAQQNPFIGKEMDCVITTNTTIFSKPWKAHTNDGLEIRIVKNSVLQHVGGDYKGKPTKVKIIGYNSGQDIYMAEIVD